MKRELLAVFAPVQVVIALPALDLAIRNVEAIGVHASMAESLGWIGLAALIVGLAAMLLRGKHWFARYGYAMFLLIGPGWILYTAAATYVGKGPAFVSLLVAVPIGAAAFIRRSTWEVYLSQGSAAFSIGLAALLIFNAINLASIVQERSDAERLAASADAPRSAEFAGAGSGLPDVYHLVFDEFQTEMFEVVLTPEQKEALAGFTFFPNASTPFGRTDMALGATFSGKAYNYEGEPYEYIHQSLHGEDSLISRLKGLGYHTSGLLYKLYPVRSTSPFDWTRIQKRYADFSGHEGLGSLFLSVWVFASFPATVTNWILPQSRVDQLEAQTLLPASNSFRSVLSLRRFLGNADIWKRQGPHYVFVHMFVPHFPLELDGDCGLHEVGSVTAEMQSTCAINLIIEFIEALKHYGRFEDSLMVVHGDHGARYSIDGSSLVKWFSKDPQWTRARSRPMLLAKPAGMTGDLPFRVDRRNTDLYDIYPTVLDGVGVDRHDLIGSSLFAAEPPERTRYYHFYRKNKDWRLVVEGSLRRYVVTQDGVEFDKYVAIDR